jgi:hypothetical protein
MRVDFNGHRVVPNGLSIGKGFSDSDFDGRHFLLDTAEVDFEGADFLKREGN